MSKPGIPLGRNACLAEYHNRGNMYCQPLANMYTEA